MVSLQIQSCNCLFQPPSLGFVRKLILLNLVVSFTESVNGCITFRLPFRASFFLKLLICEAVLPSLALICSSSHRQPSKCRVIQPPLLHFCHLAASIRKSLVCLCSVSDEQEMWQKQKIPTEWNNHQHLFQMFNLKMSECFWSQKKRRVIGECMWLSMCHCYTH